MPYMEVWTPARSSPAGSTPPTSVPGRVVAGSAGDGCRVDAHRRRIKTRCMGDKTYC
jgi:hypothetical protein